MGVFPLVVSVRHWIVRAVTGAYKDRSKEGWRNREFGQSFSTATANWTGAGAQEPPVAAFGHCSSDTDRAI